MDYLPPLGDVASYMQVIQFVVWTAAGIAALLFKKAYSHYLMD